jgi:hypothetical protein
VGQDGQGGGLYSSGDTLVVQDSTLGFNAATGGKGGDGGGSLGPAGPGGTGGPASGGGLDSNQDVVTITNSTLGSNTATGGAGGDSGSSVTVAARGGSANGAGADFSGDWTTPGAVSVVFATISGNIATAGPTGAGTAGYLVATAAGGGINGPVAISNSIVAGNSAIWRGSDFFPAPDAGAGLTSLGHNLIGNPAGSSGWVDSDLLNVDPKLGPLQDNGGPTMTMALLPGSPAIDAGVPVDGITTDQRGISRTDFGPPDIGAFEFAPLTMVGMVVNDGMAQRSNDTTLAVTFNQWTNIQSLIDQGTIVSAVQLFCGGSQVPLGVSRYSYNRETFTLTVDLCLAGSPKTMLADGRYELRVATGLVYALNNPSNPVVDVAAGFEQLVGDYKGDGAVTLADRADFLQHYGSQLGQGLYDACYDLNGDGIVNLQDYILWTERLGKTV